MGHCLSLVAVILLPGRRGEVFTEGGMYDQLAQPCGIYRSQLERQWANWFQLNHIHAVYVDEHWHDFVVDGRFVEIKPHGETFLLAAISRMPQAVTLVVIQGSIFNNLAWSCVRMDDVRYVDCKPIDIHKHLGIKEHEANKRK